MFAVRFASASPLEAHMLFLPRAGFASSRSAQKTDFRREIIELEGVAAAIIGRVCPAKFPEFFPRQLPGNSIKGPKTGTWHDNLAR